MNLIDINSIIFLVIFLFPFLHLPYYWDEAWVYGPGVRTMCIKGPGLLPDALPVDISRGHPLLFYFLGGIWLKIFGNTIFVSHTFAITVAIVFLSGVYKLCAAFLSKRLAFLVILLLMLQPIFLAQSCLVLPEMMMAMWTMFCLWAFYSGKKLLYILFGALMILTKETGVVCIITLGLNEMLFDVFAKNNQQEIKPGIVRLLKNYKRYLFISVPILIAAVYFVIQKSMYGWLFFPEHLGYVSFKWNDFSHKFIRYFSYLFIFDGRNALFFGGLTAIVIIIFRRKKAACVPTGETKIRVLSCMLLFIFNYLCFSSANFYSDRYLMSVIAPMIILSVYFIDTAMRKTVLKWIAFSALVISGIYYSMQVRTNSDHNLGYADCVKLYKETVDYCVKEKFSKKKVCTGFLMKYVLTDTLTGYLDSRNVFTNIDSRFDPSVELCIFSSLESTPYLDSIKTNIPMSLVKSFKAKNSNIEIFQIVR
ncbi:hypothetical protein BH11BAC7_BH11BAC7_07290 [soil metagenome]